MLVHDMALCSKPCPQACLVLKQFRRIPLADLEMVLPGAGSGHVRGLTDCAFVLPTVCCTWMSFCDAPKRMQTCVSRRSGAC